MAGLDRFRVVVENGPTAEPGVVVRLPGVLVVARTGRPETHEVAKQLLAACAEVATEDGPAFGAGRRLLRRVAFLLAESDADDVPDFVLLATVNDRLAALVHGAMELTVDGPDPLQLSGAESATWVDRLLPGEFRRLDIGGAGEPRPPGAEGGAAGPLPLDLRIGAVAGVGVTLLASGPQPGAAGDGLGDLPGVRAAAQAFAADLTSGSPEPNTGPESIPSLPSVGAPSAGGQGAENLSAAPPVLSPLSGPAAVPERADARPARDFFAARVPVDAAADAAALDAVDTPFDPAEPAEPAEPAAEPEAAPRGSSWAAGPVLELVKPGRTGGAPEDGDDELGRDTDIDADPPTELAGAARIIATGEDTESDALTDLPGRGFDVDDLIDDQDMPTVLPGQNEAQVEGILCANHHFNHPAAPYCIECGLPLAQQTNRRVWGPRPTVGVLVFDDGLTVNVDTDLVIGRQPDRDDAVRAGRAKPLLVEDAESAVSRVHAVISLNGWDAVITDQGSANGTYIAPPEATVWTPLNPHDPAPLVPGTRVQVGKRTFVFNSHLQV
jgi:FHA domain